ncbi:hypothetical protein LR48_Vigan06g020600 [Vigna angularis]|uniref:Protein LOL1 Protein LSD ONE LIKE 1 n=1 Tax=Phaseolus angularis TaxID=3914 RepID=A0A0L9UPS3_PHAAN|nr:Protein LOL1 Protein LSD ONE LIKE 1 [Vigna angularis]KOM44900.1 hypothetical protein LR48_Vigan06g020600 [Vigna angularis]
MPVPLAPYPPPLPPPPYAPPPNGTFAYSTLSLFAIHVGGPQSHLVCSGCRNLLLYPVGATSVCCAVCNAVTTVPPPEMAQLVCGGCHTLLMYIRGATSVQCSCCHTVNLALEANQVAHVNCGNCKMLLRYQYGARSVKCAVCSFVTLVGASTSTTEQKFNT